MSRPSCPKFAYLVHDVNDAAVERRARAFELGGATVEIAGFLRSGADTRPRQPGTHVIGQTHDARLVQRALLVARQVARPSPKLDFVRSANAIVARNLEMLAIATRLRKPGQRLVYECLDLHRAMLSPTASGKALRLLERRLLRRTDLVITSSPAYRRHHFREKQSYAGPIMLVENKVMEAPSLPTRPPGRSDNVHRIGWFGMLRCRRSFELLRQLVRTHDGLEVVIAGRPSPAVFDDLDADARAVEGMRFVGPYRPGDLAALYADVDFSWCIDFYEEGLNSDWLLPNRLYESIAHGAVPIALASVETGRWLCGRQVGLVVDDVASVGPKLAMTSDERLARLRRGVRDLPSPAVIFDPADHRALVSRIAADR